MPTIETGFGGEIPLRLGAAVVGVAAGVLTFGGHVVTGGDVGGGAARGAVTGVGVAVTFYLGVVTRSWL